MILLILTLLIIFIFIITTLYINDKVNKEMIKNYGHLATLNSVWSTSHGIMEETYPWDPILVKIISNKCYKHKRYVTYIEIKSHEQRTYELAYFLTHFTFQHP